MLEVLKYGTSKYGVWVIGNLKYKEFEILDIFNTNLKSEDVFKENSSLPVKKLKIRKDKNSKIVFSLEF